jgi:glycerol kinase
MRLTVECWVDASIAEERDVDHAHCQHGLLPTVAWSRDGDVTFALDGAIYVAGAAVQWLRDGLGWRSTRPASSRA